MEERRRILELIEQGEIGAAEGVRRLEELEDEIEVEPEVIPPQPTVPPVRPGLVRILWQVVFWSGVTLLVGGALLVAAVYAWSAAAGWLICGWPLFALGVLVVVVGWWMREARWFALRVKERGGRRVNLALPMPLGPLVWLLRVLRPFIPQVADTGVDELLAAMHDEVRDGQPFVVEVDEGEDGEQVHVYFG